MALILASTLLLEAARRDDRPLPAGNHLLLLQILFYTGMRRGEVASLRVSDVCLHEKVFMIRKAKGGKFRLIPTAVALLVTITNYLKNRKLSRPEYLVQSQNGSRLGGTSDRGDREAELPARGQQCGITPRAAAYVCHHGTFLPGEPAHREEAFWACFHFNHSRVPSHGQAGNGAGCKRRGRAHSPADMWR